MRKECLKVWERCTATRALALFGDLAAAMARAGWQAMADGLLALAVGSRLVYAHWGTDACAPAAGVTTPQVQPGEWGWVDV